MKDFIIITGPTGIGKTKISIDAAKQFDGEIISADSMQIYKHLDIGTAKVTEDEMAGIPHHLIDIVEPGEEFTVKDYRALAKEKIKDIQNKGKLPIIVGGTGLYINSLIKPFHFGNTPPIPEFREEMNKLVAEEGLESVYKLLEKESPEAASKVDPKNKNRVIRALEISIYKVDAPPAEVPEYKYLFIGLNTDRDVLYDRINKRVDIMVEDGLLEEVKNLCSMGMAQGIRATKAIGFVEILDYLEGLITYEEAIDKIKQHSRNYAKRQLTWFRRENIKWFDISDENYENEILRYIGENIE